jgi:hypothetical protein
MLGQYAVMFLKADRVEKVAPGLYRLEMQGMEPVSKRDRATLLRLFPHTADAAFRLLDREVLMAALASEAEIQLALTDDDGEPREMPLDSVVPHLSDDDKASVRKVMKGPK